MHSLIYFIGNVELLHKPKFQEHPDGDLERIVIRQNHVIEFIAVRYRRKWIFHVKNTSKGAMDKMFLKKEFTRK